MSYEFADEGGAGERFQSPDFWGLVPDKIYKITPGEPTWVHYASVIHDPKTGDIGLDTNDRLPLPNELAPHPHIGVMLVNYLHEGQNQQGYLADLRFVRTLVERELDFDDPSEDMQNYKTAPVLGAVFADDDAQLYFRARRDRALLQPFAASMLEAFDALRGPVASVNTEAQKTLARAAMAEPPEAEQS